MNTPGKKKKVLTATSGATVPQPAGPEVANLGWKNGSVLKRVDVKILTKSGKKGWKKIYI